MNPKEGKNGVYLKFKAFLKHKYLVQWVTDSIFSTLITKSIYLSIKKILMIKSTLYLFLLLLHDISWGLRHLAPNFIFTSLLWQLSCIAWHWGKKSVLVVEIHNFFGLGQLAVTGHLLPSHLGWFYWQDGSHSFAMPDELERKDGI